MKLEATKRNKKAIEARIELIAAERDLARSEVRRAKASGETVLNFGLRHNVCLDWLFFGDLRGLLTDSRRPHDPDRHARLLWLVDRRVRKPHGGR